jgi:hypothetical protein
MTKPSLEGYTDQELQQELDRREGARKRDALGTLLSNAANRCRTTTITVDTILSDLRTALRNYGFKGTAI